MRVERKGMITGLFLHCHKIMAKAFFLAASGVFSLQKICIFALVRYLDG